MAVGPSQHDMGGNPCVSGGAVEGIHHADSHRGAEQNLSPWEAERGDHESWPAWAA